MWTRAVVALLWSASVVAMGVTVRAQSGAWFREIPAGDETYDEEQEVVRHLPMFVQWVVDDDRHLDFIVAVNYDRDPGKVASWNGRNNWENAKLLADAATHVLYGGVVAVTNNQLYLVYYYFHPRDHKRAFGHENDLEGALLAVDRASGQVVHVQALAHGHFDERHYCYAAHVTWGQQHRLRRPGRPPTGYRRRNRVGCSRVRLDELVVWIEGKGHGGHLTSTLDLGRVNRNQQWWIKYVYGEAGTEEPDYHAGDTLTSGEWPHLSASGFAVRPIWPLFRGMFADDGARRAATQLYAKKLDAGSISIRGYRERAAVGIYRGMRGDNGKDDRARFPWGEGSKYARFLDPVSAIVKLERAGRPHGHDKISCDYHFNPYLQTILEGKVPSSDLRFKPRRLEGWFPKRCAP